MCVVSMVLDKFSPMFPTDDGANKPLAPTAQPAFTIGPFPNLGTVDLDELRKILDDFRVALDAARTVDRLTGQPDCEDPEKAKLLERVARLEAQVAELTRKPKRRSKK